MEIRAPASGILRLRRDGHGDLPKLGTTLSPGNWIAELPVLDAMEAELFGLRGHHYCRARRSGAVAQLFVAVRGAMASRDRAPKRWCGAAVHGGICSECAVG